MRNRSVSSNILILCACIFLFNAPFFLLSNIFKFDRPLISYESIVCIYILPTSVFIGAFFLFLTWICDLLTFTANIYYLGSPAQVISNLAFAFELKFDKNIILTIFIACLALLLIGKLFYIASSYARGIKLQYYFSAFFIVLACDVCNGTSFFSTNKRLEIPYNIAGSPILNLTRSVYKNEPSNVEALADGQSILDYIDVQDWVYNNPNKSVIFLIVESYGLIGEKTILDYIRASLVDEYIESKYEIKEVSVPFSGATTSGELRSLCKVKASYNAMVFSSPEISSLLESCLPNKLKANGLYTVGIHGFSGSMFDRRNWWRQIGLTDAYFKEDFIANKYKLCGNVFRGACDTDIIRHAVELAKKKASFIYLLSLETHLPIPYKVPDKALKLKCEIAKFDEDVCSLIEGIADVMRGSNRLIRNLPQPPLVIIVGDHAPPFSSPVKRDLFSSTNVPAWILIPKR